MTRSVPFPSSAKDLSDSSGVPRWPYRFPAHSAREVSGLAEREPAAQLVAALARSEAWRRHVAGYLADPSPTLRDAIARQYAPARKAKKARTLSAGLLDHCRELHVNVVPAPAAGPDRAWLLESMSTYPAFMCFDVREPREGDARQWPDQRSYSAWQRGVDVLLARGSAQQTCDASAGDPRDRHAVSALLGAVCGLDDDDNAARRRRIKRAA